MNETSDYMEMTEIPNKFLKNLTALKMLTNKSMKLVYFVLNEIKLQLHIALTFLLQILPKTLTFKAFKAFIKPFEAPQRSMKIKI